MTKEEYQDFVLRYKGCGACFPMYHTLSRFEKMWFTAIQKDVAELEKENAELKTKVTALENANRAMVKELDDTTSGGLNILQNVVKNKEELTNAKELLKQWLQTSKASGCDNINIVSDTEQFLSEVEK